MQNDKLPAVLALCDRDLYDVCHGWARLERELTEENDVKLAILDSTNVTESRKQQALACQHTGILLLVLTAGGRIPDGIIPDAVCSNGVDNRTLQLQCQALFRLRRRAQVKLRHAIDHERKRASAHEAVTKNDESLGRALLDHAPIGVAMLDKRGNILESNARLQRWLGRSPAELFSYELGALCAPECRQAVQQGVAMAGPLTAGHGEFELTCLRKDGSPVALRATVLPTRGSDDKSQYLMAMFELATPAAAAVEAVSDPAKAGASPAPASAAETVPVVAQVADPIAAMLRAQIERLPDRVILTDRLGRVQYCNLATRSATGLNELPTDGIAELLARIHPPRVAKRVLERGLPLALKSGHWYGELPSNDGHVMACFIWCVHSSGAERFLILTTDITERASADQQVRTMGAMVDQAGESVEFLDLRGRLVYANRSFEVLTGYPRAEAIGHESTALLRTADADHAPALVEWHELGHGEVWRKGDAITCSDGTQRIVMTSVSAVRDTKGAAVGYVVLRTSLQPSSAAARAAASGPKTPDSPSVQPDTNAPAAVSQPAPLPRRAAPDVAEHAAATSSEPAATAIDLDTACEACSIDDAHDSGVGI